MSKSDSLKTVLEIINEVRGLLGYSSVTRLDSDKYTKVHLRLLNKVMSNISDKGDWQEMQRTVEVTAVTSTTTYGLGITEPVKRILEVSFSSGARSLDYLPLDRLNQYQRRGGTGIPRFFTIKGVDDQGNPQFNVFRQPGSAQSGQTFSIEYYIAPRLYDLNSADEEVPFQANLVIQGLYAAALLEQNGAVENREYLLAQGEFEDMREEALRRFNADTGTDIFLAPSQWR